MTPGFLFNTRFVERVLSTDRAVATVSMFNQVACPVIRNVTRFETMHGSWIPVHWYTDLYGLPFNSIQFN